MSVHTIGYNSSDNLRSRPPDNNHNSDNCLLEGITLTFVHEMFSTILFHGSKLLVVSAICLAVVTVSKALHSLNTKQT